MFAQIGTDMTLLARVRTVWSGFPGGPGISTMYLLDPAVGRDALRDFFAVAQNLVPNDVTMAVASEGDMIEDTTGALSGTWSETPLTILPGTGGSTYAGPAGACVDWLTSVVVDGRRPMGRTFLVPLGSNVFDNGGSLTSSAQNALKAGGDALVSAMSGNLVVWHRPRKASAGPPVVTARAGANVEVTACRVPDKAVVLRSRRD